MRAQPLSRYRANRFGPSLALVLLAGACAPVTQAPPVDPGLAKAEADKQHQIAVERYVAELRRLNAIAFRIFTANADLCQEKGKSALGFGFKIGNAYSFPKEMEPGARRVIGGGGHVHLIAVAPDSPAARAGLRNGDAILALDGIPVVPGEDEKAARDFGKQLAERVQFDRPVVFRIRRDGAEAEFAVRPAVTCDYGYNVGTDSEVNASADGKAIKIDRGMMRFASADEELATVFGHEMAHNLMGHIDAGNTNIMIGYFADLLFTLGTGLNTGGLFADIGRRAYSQEFETEADYVGLYLMARAGYDISGTPNFWRRMGVEHPASIRTNHASSHPSAPYRFVSLEKTVEEIERKKAAGLPLRPQLKKTEPAPAAAPPAN
jgi:hypothetical protein